MSWKAEARCLRLHYTSPSPGVMGDGQTYCTDKMDSVKSTSSPEGFNRQSEEAHPQLKHVSFSGLRAGLHLRCSHQPFKVPTLLPMCSHQAILPLLLPFFQGSHS